MQELRVEVATSSVLELCLHAAVVVERSPVARLVQRRPGQTWGLAETEVLSQEAMVRGRALAEALVDILETAVTVKTIKALPATMGLVGARGRGQAAGLLLEQGGLAAVVGSGFLDQAPAALAVATTEVVAAGLAAPLAERLEITRMVAQAALMAAVVAVVVMATLAALAALALYELCGPAIAGSIRQQTQVTTDETIYKS